MNPPYLKNLHLKILELVCSFSSKVINISPIRWLQDPLAKYKQNSDYSNFEDTISKKIEDIEFVKADVAESLLDASFSMNLGIYTIGNGGFDYKQYANTIVDKMVSKIEDNLNNHIKFDIPSKWSVVVPLMVGGDKGRLNNLTNWLPTYDRVLFHDNKNHKRTNL